MEDWDIPFDSGMSARTALYAFRQLTVLSAIDGYSTPRDGWYRSHQAHQDFREEQQHWVLPVDPKLGFAQNS